MIHAKLKLNKRHAYEILDILRNCYAIFPKTTPITLLKNTLENSIFPPKTTYLTP